ncbi:MAG: hypothetical protein CMO74_14065 [Verrucomicrobiales bacterium]|nr:hypothetical protein [Verrucomicrobiales bacterium]|tara:strand:+ start:45219 stop:45695 length:477 start_codon:yes stop_codon:yes gene_type:complete
MTLRDLIYVCSYKSVFNIIHKTYFKDKSNEEISDADVSFLGAWQNLYKLQKNPNKDWKVYITEKEDDNQKFIDVCWYNEVEDELYAIDLVEWEELIDSEIYKAVTMDNTTAAAHILWEITFFGFSASAVRKEGGKLRKLAERIESGEEKLIPWNPEAT